MALDGPWHKARAVTRIRHRAGVVGVTQAMEVRDVPLVGVLSISVMPLVSELMYSCMGEWDKNETRQEVHRSCGNSPFFKRKGWPFGSNRGNMGTYLPPDFLSVAMT